jgi:hypothetical protein
MLIATERHAFTSMGPASLIRKTTIRDRTRGNALG